MTLAAWESLTHAKVVVLRTERHPCVAEILPRRPSSAYTQSCDDLYTQHAAFADVYTAIVARVMALAQTHAEVVYAVPGHPCVGEMTTPALQLARSSRHCRRDGSRG